MTLIAIEVNYSLNPKPLMRFFNTITSPPIHHSLTTLIQWCSFLSTRNNFIASQPIAFNGGAFAAHSSDTEADITWIHLGVQLINNRRISSIFE
jgi:hypothetical protein